MNKSDVERLVSILNKSTEPILRILKVLEENPGHFLCYLLASSGTRRKDFANVLGVKITEERDDEIIQLIISSENGTKVKITNLLT